MALQFRSGVIVFAFVALSWTSPCLGQTAAARTAAPGQEGQHQEQEVPEHKESALTGQQLLPQPSGTIRGMVIDQSGALMAGARVTLSRENGSPSREMVTGTDGQFSFADAPPGNFKLTVASQGFGAQTSSGVLQPGEIQTVPQIALDVASTITEVDVGVSRAEVAEEQIKVEEKQRIFGAIPNFYVTYLPNPVPLTSRQKLELAWKSVIDPVTFLVVGGAAGVEQAQDHFIGYGQGAEGYAKRFGAGYADTVSATFIGGYLLPSLLKQDPRYFYKGTGSKGSRFLYAIAFSVVCKGDNGRWQPNYSGILGSLAAGGISNIYYPSQDRNGAELTFENAGIGIASNAVTNVFQEFVIRKLTPKTPGRDPNKP